jgi:hypothetical protein
MPADVMRLGHRKTFPPNGCGCFEPFFGRQPDDCASTTNTGSRGAAVLVAFSDQCQVYLAHFTHCFARQLHDMKAVDHDLRLRQMLPHTFLISRTHVNGCQHHLAGACSMCRHGRREITHTGPGVIYSRRACTAHQAAQPRWRNNGLCKWRSHQGVLNPQAMAKSF